MKSHKANPSPDSSIVQFEREYVRPKPGRVLIVGSQVYHDKPDRRKLYADVVGVDMQAGPGVDVVHDMENYLPASLGQFDHIECMSVLEHCRQPWRMAVSIEQAMLPGATIFVSVPFVFRLHGYPDDYWRMAPNGVRFLFSAITWQHVMIAGERLHAESAKPDIVKMPYPHLARCETVAFGAIT